ncbi:MAG: bZIP transcription factor [Rubripirellula sp.]|nr:bZIP transcription factor [Rubripirellula sp.]
MSKRLTLLLVAPMHLSRIDMTVGRKPKVIGAWKRNRILGEPIAGQIDSALRSGPKRIGEVWVIDGDAWTGVVTMERDLVGMLQDDEWQQSLALETEAFSGLSAFESRLGAIPLPPDESGDSRWWVTQITQSDWQDAKCCIEQFGAKWGGMAHPAVAGAVFPIPAPDHWATIQLCGETTIATTGTGERVLDVMVVGDLKTQRTLGQIAQWRIAHSVDDVTWIGTDVSCSHAMGGDDRCVEIGGDASAESDMLNRWACVVAGEFSTAAKYVTTANPPSIRLPLIAAEVPPMSNRTAMIAAMAMAICAMLCCFGLHTLTAETSERVVRESAKLDRQRQQFAAGKKELLALEKQVTQMRIQVRELATRNTTLRRNFGLAQQIRKFQQTRWAHVVSSLARCGGGDCWVRAISSKNDSVCVQGIALDNHDVSSFASKLEATTARHGWAAHPAQTETNPLGFVEFKIVLDVDDGFGDPACGINVGEMQEPENNSAGPNELVSLREEF